MRNYFKTAIKRAAAGITALAMCAGLGGCYSEDKAWAAKMGDTTLPIGGYIYYLTSAFAEGSGQVSPQSNVLGSEIDGKDAAQWLRDKAADYLRSYYYVNDKFDQLGLSLSEDDQSSIESTTASMWSYNKTALESMGIAQSSFEEAYAVYNTKLSKLLKAMYGKGGELEIPEDELKEYYTGEYIYYQYFTVELTKPGEEEDQSVDMDDEEKAQVKSDLEEYVQEISSGKQTIDRAAANYANQSGTEPNLGDSVAIKAANMSDLFKNAIEGIDNSEAVLIDATTRCYVVQKLDVADDFKALLEDEDRYSSLLAEMKAEEFMEYTIEQGKALDIQINERAINSVNVSSVAKALGEKGTSSAESSSSSESSSSQDDSSDSSNSSNSSDASSSEDESSESSSSDDASSEE